MTQTNSTPPISGHIRWCRSVDQYGGADKQYHSPAGLVPLNDPFVHQQSQLIARRIGDHSQATDQRIEFAYELMFSRPADASEIAAARDFMQDAHHLLQTSGVEGEQLELATWQAWVRSLAAIE